MKLLSLLVLACAVRTAPAEETVVVRPTEIDDVLSNPGIGFTTFQRFNGDPLLGGDQEAHYPESSVAYFRLYWNDIEPTEGQYRWDVIDNLLKGAHEHHQTLMLRLAAHSYSRRADGDSDGVELQRRDYPRGFGGRQSRRRDVPQWYRDLVGSDYQKLPVQKWSVAPEDPRYAKYYGRLIHEFGKRYDGHPDLESVDLAIVGAWGEGAGASLLSDRTCHALVDAYVESFRKTPLVALLMDARTNKYALSKGAVGWRADCLGDMGGFQPNWSHMEDRYPEALVKNGLVDAWKKAPVNFEVCWVMNKWADEGWDVDYIIDQSLKWHISSFNAKSSAVPEKWLPQVNRWLKSMGYRFVLRKFTYPEEVASGGEMQFTSWWENKGVAPCYREFPLAIKLEKKDDPKSSAVVLTDADIRTWLPGDNTFDAELTVPELPAGEYTLLVGLIDPTTSMPKTKLAIKGVRDDGWYPMGMIKVKAE